MGCDGPALRRRDVSGRRQRQVGKATAPLIAVLAVVVVVAAVEFYAIEKFGRRNAAPPAAIAARAAPTAASPIGFIDAPASESIRGPAVVVSGWPSRVNSTPTISPSPRTSPMTGNSAWSLRRPPSNCSPRAAA